MRGERARMRWNGEKDLKVGASEERRVCSWVGGLERAGEVGKYRCSNKRGLT